MSVASPREHLGRPAGQVRPAGRLPNLQILRAFAAGSVMLSHAASLMRSSRGDDRFLLVFNDALGSFGVALFFALSGFLMATLVRTGDPSTFLVHRVVRIYPTFLLAAGIVAVVSGLGGAGFGLDPLALSLAPVGIRPYPLGVEWTLVYETAFYLSLFALATLRLARFTVPVALIWLAILAAVSLAGAATNKPFPLLTRVLLADANAPFALGLLLPALLARGLLRPPVAWLGLPLAALAIWGELEPMRWVQAVPAVLIVAATIGSRQTRGRTVAARAGIRLGDWSYALYLVHLSAMTLAYRLAPAGAANGLAFAVAVASALGAAAILGPVDVGLYRRLRGIVDDAPATLRRLAATLFALAYVGLSGGIVVSQMVEDAARARARSELDTILPGDRTDAARLSEVLRSAGAGGRSADAAIETVGRLPGGDVVASGFVFDAGNPDGGLFVALLCRGTVATVSRPTRVRPDHGRRRIGFVVTLPAAACPPGAAILPLALDAEGRISIGRPGPTVPRG